MLGRVVGGTDVTSTTEFPYFVALMSGNQVSSDPTCAGTILDENYILTAAHCGSPKKDFQHFYYKLKF